MRVFELDMTNESIKTWMRDEYRTHRIDELLLVQGGTVVGLPGEDEDRGCVVG
jgi:uncharacterized protein YndB with AHSA1/START domain